MRRTGGRLRSSGSTPISCSATGIPLLVETLPDETATRTDRIPYFQSLRLLRDADHLIVPGSDNPDYTASKLYPYILSRRPVPAVCHQRSGAVDILQKIRAGEAVAFDGSMNVGDLVGRVFETLSPILEELPYTPNTDWDAFQPYTAEAMTRRQVEVFDRVVSTAARAAEAPAASAPSGWTVCS